MVDRLPPQLTRVAAIVLDDTSRIALGRLLGRAPDLLTVGVFGSTAEALRVLAEERPDIVLVDGAIREPISAVECIRRLRAMHRGTFVLVLGVYEDEEEVCEGVKAGASGYLLKRMTADTILQRIRETHAGMPVINALLAHRLHREYETRASKGLVLKDDERAILEALEEGHDYGTAARRAGVHIEDVYAAVRAILSRLHAFNGVPEPGAVGAARAPGRSGG